MVGTIKYNQFVFHLPTANGVNKVLKEWILQAGIEKHITWSCARLSFSILMQDERIDEATVACLLGHTTTVQFVKHINVIGLNLRLKRLMYYPILMSPKFNHPLGKRILHMFTHIRPNKLNH